MLTILLLNDWGGARDGKDTPTFYKGSSLEELPAYPTYTLAVRRSESTTRRVQSHDGLQQ